MDNPAETKAKTVEEIKAALDAFAGIDVEHTEKAVRAVLQETFRDDFCNEDVTTTLDLLKSIRSLAHPEPLQEYGYKVEKAQAGGYLLKNIDGGPICTFGSLGARTAKDLVHRTDAPLEVVERALAILADSRPHEEQGEDDERIWVRYVPTVIGSDFLAEEIWDGRSAPHYVKCYFGSDEFEYLREIDLGETDGEGRRIIHRPLYNDHLTKGMVMVPMKPVVCTFEEVIQEGFEFVLNSGLYDACGKDSEVKLLCLIALGSWFLDRMESQKVIKIAGVGVYAPIIPIRGPSGTGKNRLATGLRGLSYRPFYDLSTVRVPSLYRPLEQWRGTLILDEADFARTGSTAEVIHFLNSRAQGTPIARQNPDNVSESQVFDNFGQTIVTQRQHFDDNATEDRCVPFYSERSAEKIPTVEPNVITEMMLALQNKLLYLRLRYWHEFVIDKTQWHEKLDDARLNASILPVMAMAKFDPSVEKILDEVVSKVQEIKTRIKAGSVDGMIVNILWERVENGLFDTHNTMYYILDEKIPSIDGEDEEERIALTTTIIKDKLGFSPKTVRKVLVSLNISPEEAPTRIRIDKKTVRPIFFRLERLEKLLKEFVVGYEPDSLARIVKPKSHEDSVTHVTDVTLTYTGEDLERYISETEDNHIPPGEGTPHTEVSQVSHPDDEEHETPKHVSDEKSALTGQKRKSPLDCKECGRRAVSTSEGSLFRLVKGRLLCKDCAKKESRSRRKKKRPHDPKTEPLQDDVKRKPLPRAVKQFEKWLKPFPNAGLRGVEESDIRKAHGERYLDGISKYEKKGWIEQRGSRPDLWWISDAGKAALRGDS